MLGVSRAVVMGLIDAGFVSPLRGPRNQHQFSFQDLVLIRTAQALQRANIPTRKIMRSLTRLRAALPDELPLTGLRITAVGDAVAVHDLGGPREAESGQLLMDFELVSVSSDSISRVAILDALPTPPAPDESDRPRRWLDRGEALEAAYRQALSLDPGYTDAYLDLGALLCDTGRCADAVDLYDGALQACQPSALLHFNRAIALEDQGRSEAALESYARCLDIDAAFADAHFNAARLLETCGDVRGALRHLNAYRRLAR